MNVMVSTPLLKLHILMEDTCWKLNLLTMCNREDTVIDRGELYIGDVGMPLAVRLR